MSKMYVAQVRSPIHLNDPLLKPECIFIITQFPKPYDHQNSQVCPIPSVQNSPNLKLKIKFWQIKHPNFAGSKPQYTPRPLVETTFHLNTEL